MPNQANEITEDKREGASLGRMLVYGLESFQRHVQDW